MSIEFHRRMLADRVRHDAFREALRRVIRPGVSRVADIGAGTGILALFARELGAREVWLYEPGAVLELAAEIAAANGVDGLHFVPEHSLAVEEPPLVDVVVAEVFGNFAYEENVLETLRDAHRFLAAGGTLIPHSLEQWAAPVVTDRFERELASWRGVGYGLRFDAAERVTRNNMYVYAIEPADLLAVPPAKWDDAVFDATVSSRREGRVSWAASTADTVFGLALWWDCALVPGVPLSTSPFAPRTHWDQIYLPVLEPLALEPGDELALEIVSETGGGESGIDVTWTVEHSRSGAVRSRQVLDLRAGFVG